MGSQKIQTHTHACINIQTYLQIKPCVPGKGAKSTSHIYINTSHNADKAYRDTISKFKQFLPSSIFQKGIGISKSNVCGNRQHFIAMFPFNRSSLLCLWVTIPVSFHYKGAYCYLTTYCGISFCFSGDLSDLLRKALRYGQHTLYCSFIFSQSLLLLLVYCL